MLAGFANTVDEETTVWNSITTLPWAPKEVDCQAAEAIETGISCPFPIAFRGGTK